MGNKRAQILPAASYREVAFKSQGSVTAVSAGKRQARRCRTESLLPENDTAQLFQKQETKHPCACHDPGHPQPAGSAAGVRSVRAAPLAWRKRGFRFTNRCFRFPLWGVVFPLQRGLCSGRAGSSAGSKRGCRGTKGCVCLSSHPAAAGCIASEKLMGCFIVTAGLGGGDPRSKRCNYTR